MKKILAVVLALMMMLCLFTASAQETMMGGWTICDDTAVSAQAQTAFDKAMEGFTGVGYTAVAQLATQVVAGTNYCLLVRGTIEASDSADFYALMFVYSGVDGTAEILEITDLGVCGETGLSGGWTAQTGTTEPAATAFSEAMQSLTGVEYIPVQLLSSQVVSGTNYRFLCQAAPVVPDAQRYYCIVTVYAPLSGEAEVSEVTTLTITVDGPLSAAAFDGSYMDENSQRATMEIYVNGDSMDVTIWWGNSATETVIWNFTAFFDGEKATYTNGIKELHTFDEKDNETVTVVYTDSEGTLSVSEDGAILWEDSQEEASKTCVFRVTLG